LSRGSDAKNKNANGEKAATQNERGAAMNPDKAEVLCTEWYLGTLAGEKAFSDPGAT
jgi:hypothetical protein